MLELTVSGAPEAGTITVIKADTIVGNFTSIVIPQRAPNGCAYTTSQSTQDSTLSVLFTTPTNCGAPASTGGKSGGSSHTTVIIAASVAGGIVLIAVIIAVFLVLFKMGKCVCLRWAREDQSSFVV